MGCGMGSGGLQGFWDVLWEISRQRMAGVTALESRIWRWASEPGCTEWEGEREAAEASLGEECERHAKRVEPALGSHAGKWGRCVWILRRVKWGWFYEVRKQGFYSLSNFAQDQLALPSTRFCIENFISPPKTHNLSLIMRTTSDKPKLSDILQSSWQVLLTTVIKHKDRETVRASRSLRGHKYLSHGILDGALGQKNDIR